MRGRAGPPAQQQRLTTSLEIGASTVAGRAGREQSGPMAMNIAPRRRSAVAGTLRFAVLAAVVVTSSITLARSAPEVEDFYPVSPAFWLGVTSATLSTAAIGLWTGQRIDRILGRWLEILAFAVAGYILSSATVASLIARDETSSVGGMLVYLVAGGAWVIALACAQFCAVVAHDRVVGKRSRALRATIASLTAAAFVVGCLAFPLGGGPFADAPSLLPAEFTASPIVAVVGAMFVFCWMGCLIVAPIVLWTGVRKTESRVRQGIVRAAIGSIAPFAVVLLCGLLALTIRRGETIEGDVLMIGFALALPTTAIWLAGTVGDALGTAPWRLGPVPVIVQVVLWILYALAVVQIAVPIGELIGGDRMYNAVVVTVVLAGVTVPLVHRFVQWILRRADPRRALATALIDAEGDGADRDPARTARHALRTALGDPGLDIMLALSDGRWVTSEQLPAPVPTGSDPLITAVADAAGKHRAAIMLTRPAAGLGNLLSVVRPLLERAALRAELLDQAERLDREQARASSAAHDERRRLERDLHDGVQGRLLALGLNLRLAATDLRDVEARMILDDAVEELRTAINELRSLASGATPELLVRGGLRAAVDDFVGRMPVPVRLTLPPARLDADLEAVAYFVISEAVTNAVKHAAPSFVNVSVEQRGAVVLITVRDDGIGGADPRAGTGLRGLAERVRALGGRLVVSDGDPNGTIVEAALPCAP